MTDVTACGNPRCANAHGSWKRAPRLTVGHCFLERVLYFRWTYTQFVLYQEICVNLKYVVFEYGVVMSYFLVVIEAKLLVY